MEKNIDALEKMKTRHNVQVTSWGGVATTMLYEFIEDCGLIVPENNKDWMPWKHMRKPPRSSVVNNGFRAVYLYGDPVQSLLSVFRRGYQGWLIDRLGGCAKEFDNKWSIKKFAEQEKDLFRLDEHIKGWRNAERAYPIMFVRYEKMWERLPELLCFLGIDSSKANKFPAKRERESELQNIESRTRKKLECTYKELRNYVNKMPNIFVKKKKRDRRTFYHNIISLKRKVWPINP